jgi:aminomethyltransferase
LGIKAIGFNALNIARIETGFIVANSDFITSEHAIRNNRARNPDEIGMSWMIDMNKPFFNGKIALENIRKKNKSRYVFAALEVDGKEPADGAIIYFNKKEEVGIITAATWSPTAKKSIALASLKIPYGHTIQSNLWVEIYVLKELEYYKMMKKVKIVKAPFVKLKRRSITPPENR